MKWTASMCVLLGLAVGAPAAAQTDTTNQATRARGSTLLNEREMGLNQFLGEHFAQVLRSCAPMDRPSWLQRVFGRNRSRQAPPNGADRDAANAAYHVPSDISNWSVIRDINRDASGPRSHEGSKVRVWPTSSLNALFTVVRRSSDNGIVPTAADSVIGDPIGVTWSSTNPPLLYQQESSLRREHNCVTLLTAEAGLAANLSADELRATLSTNVSSDRAQTAFAYAGVIESPITAALGLNTTIVDAPAGLDPFSVMMALWNWHQQNSDEPNPEKFVIRSRISGLALYRVAGLTQNAVLRGQAGLNVRIPFLTSESSVNGLTENRTVVRLEEFSVADWTPENEGYVPLPGPAQLASMIALSARINPVLAESVEIAQDNQPLNLGYDVLGVPTAYCQRRLWKAEAAADDNRFTQPEILQAGPVPGDERRCRFTISVQPTPVLPNTDRSQAASLPIHLNLKWGEAVRRETLILDLPVVSVPDRRAPISLVANSIGVIEIPSGSDTGTLTYQAHIRQSDSRQPVALGTGHRIVLQCRTFSTSSSTYLRSGQEGDPLVFNSTNRSLTATVPVPATLVPAGQSDPADCELEGELTFNVGNQTRSVQIPTQSFRLLRAAPPPPPSETAAGAIVVGQALAATPG